MHHRATIAIRRLLATALRGALALALCAPAIAKSPVVVEEMTAEGRVMTLDVATLMSRTPGDEVELRLAGPHDKGLLTTARVVTGHDGVQTWIGYDATRSVLTRTYITSYQGAVTGLVNVNGKRFDLLPAGSGTNRIVLVDHEAESLLPSFGATHDGLRPPMPSMVGQPRDAVSPASVDHAKVMPSPQTTIDLAVLYTSGMVTKYGNTAGVISRINLLVQVANDAYVNSEVAITLNLLGTQLTSYTNSNTNEIALEELTGKNTSSGCLLSGCPDLVPLPSIASEARAMRDSLGADLVTLVRPYTFASTNGSCGLAWVYQGVPSLTYSAQFGYAVIGDGSDSVSNTYCRTDTLAHETGHNMGLEHDRPNTSQPGVTYFAYGYGLNYPIGNPNRAALGDIMSYAAASAPFFSSPNVTCNTTTQTCQLLGGGTPLGVAGDTDTGVCTTNPATCADNARALNYTRATIAAFRNRPLVTISGTVANGASVASRQFCGRTTNGVAGTVTCQPIATDGTYQCTVPSGWAGILHSSAPAGLRIKPIVVPTGVTSDLANQNSVASSIGACNLDVDNNGLIEPATDGAAILRRMMGLNATAFTGLAGICAGNTTANAIYNATSGTYNVTGGPNTIVRTDGMVILRAMQGLTGNNVTDNLGLGNEAGATNTTWPQIQSWLNTTCGTNF